MKKQPKPKKNNLPPMWGFVIEDMRLRNEAGKKKYGVALQKFNGRNSVQDAYEEILDFTVYAKQWIEERKEMISVLKQIAEHEKMYNLTQPISHLSNEQIEQSKIATNLLKKLGEI